MPADSAEATRLLPNTEFNPEICENEVTKIPALPTS